MSGLPFNGTAVWDSLSHLVRRERNWLYRQRHPSHSQRITTSGLVEYRGACCPSGVALMPRYGAAPRIRTRSITTFWDMITIISLRAYNEKRLKKERRGWFLPALKIPGIPARKLVKGLSARCKPKPDGNGGYAKNGQSRKRAMNRSIRDAAWGMFLTMLRYKAEWYGRVFQPIDRWYPSSQICSQCGHNSGRKPLNVRAWDCPNCGTHHDRDINAAMNIRVAGLAMIACGDG